MSVEFESRRQRRTIEMQQAIGASAPAASTPDSDALASLDALLLLAQQMTVSRPASPVTSAAAAVPPQVAPAALSRRELRIQEAARLNLSQASSIFPAESVQILPPAAPAQSPPAFESVVPNLKHTLLAQPTASSRRELRDEIRAKHTVTESPTTPYAQPWGEPANEPMFQTSSGFSIDTVTNSIVLPITPDALTAQMISDTGVSLKTGSIELPNLNTGTGSITIPAAAQIADEALSIDSAASFVSDISPIAAKNLLRKNPNLDLARVKTRGSQGQMFYALTASILMLTVGGLLVVAWMYGIIK